MWEGAKGAVNAFGGFVEAKIGALCDWVQGKWQALKDFLSHPIDTIIRSNQEFSAEYSGGVDHNAYGGIYGRGAFLTTFAEDSPEAAIPIDGSHRAIDLWERTGNALGVRPQNSGAITVSFNPQITIEGNADSNTMQQAMKLTVDQLKRMLADIARDQRRLSYE